AIPKLFGRHRCVDFLEDLAGNPTGVEAGWRTAIDHDLEEDFADLRTAEPIVQSTADMQFQLMRPIQRRYHGEVDQRTLLSVEALAAPDIAPAVARNQLLKRLTEFVGRIKRAIDMITAQN